MNISISQNLKNVLKNRIKILISPILYNTVDILVENLFLSNSENIYLSVFSAIQSSVRELMRKIIINLFKGSNNDLFYKSSN